MDTHGSLSNASFRLPVEIASRLEAPVVGSAARGASVLEWDGARIAYDVECPTPEPRTLLLLVNGYQRNRLDFRAFRKRLAAAAPHVATLALDNRGCGETRFVGSAPETLTLERMARDAGALANAFAERMGLGGFSMLGISMGGMVSQILASHCTAVEKLVLVSTTAGGHGRVWPDHVGRVDPKAVGESVTYRPWPTDEEGMRKRMVRYFGPRFRERAPLLIDTMVKNMLKANARKPEGGDEGNGERNGEGNAVGTAAESPTERGSRLQFHASASFDGTGLLAHVDAETLVVTGSDDAIIPKENAYFLQAHLPSARLVEYEGVGHLVLIEEPEAFVMDVAGFLG